MIEAITKFLLNTDSETIHVYTNPVRRLLGLLPKPAVELGTLTNGIIPLPFILSGPFARNHKWIMGKTRTGKSKLLADMGSQLILQGQPVTVIDPHRDLGSELLIQLTQAGYFERQDAFDKFWYIDFGVQDTQHSPTHFVPFNILNQTVDKYTVARGVVEAMKRVWPYLRDQAPHFENVMLNSLLVLIENKLPLTEIDRLLTDQTYRGKLLEQVTDEKVINYFLYRYDKWNKDQAFLRESTLNKTTLFTFTPVLRYSLGAKDNILDFRRIMDEGISVVFNLSGLDEETQKLIGCFLTVGFEEAAKSREHILDRSKRRDYHLFIDEFDKFSAQSATSLSDILAKCLKYRLYLTLANQTLSQTTESLLGALQNTATFMFTLGPTDAEKMAVWYCDYERQAKTHEVDDELARTRTHPQLENPHVTHEAWKHLLKGLPKRSFYAIFEDRRWLVKTRTLPPIRVGWDTIATLKRTYTERLMVSRESIAARESEAKNQPEPQSVTIGREKPVTLE